MNPTDGARSFLATGQDYDRFMGRYSIPLAAAFADFATVVSGQSALDVGCGPGALTGVLADRLGVAAVSAVDPSPPFVAECATRHPGVTVRPGRAEALPFDDAGFDRVLAQLVLHFVTDPAQVATEFRRVLRPGGVAATCVWDAGAGMEMLRLFWESAQLVDPRVAEDAGALRFGGPGEIAELLTAASFEDVEETTVEVRSTYAGFEELWSGFLAGIGPAGTFCLSLTEERRAVLHDELFDGLGGPAGEFWLTATARCVRGRSPR